MTAGPHDDQLRGDARVEALVSEGPDGQMSAVALDPARGRRCDHTYLAVVTGRDDRDVAPTTGRCHAEVPGVPSACETHRVTEIPNGAVVPRSRMSEPPQLPPHR